MVASKIIHSVIYHEKRNVDNDDLGKLATLYELEVENRLISKQNIVIACSTIYYGRIKLC
jgi:hypothetical protein